LKCQIK